MSLQWTLVAAFLYAEIFAVILLLLPIISARTWHSFFKSKFFKAIGSQSNIYFSVFIIILVLLFLDSIREMKKYTADKEHEAEHGHLDAELQHSMKLFRAQRNFYIAGFALFLCLVIRRLVSLINAQATLIASCEASMKQAQSATDAAEKLLKEKEERSKSEKESADNLGNIQREQYEKDLNSLKEELDKTKEELRKSKIDFSAMKQQAESVAKEYDNLLREHEKLQHQVSSGPDKKDE